MKEMDLDIGVVMECDGRRILEDTCWRHECVQIKKVKLILERTKLWLWSKETLKEQIDKVHCSINETIGKLNEVPFNVD